MPGGGSRGVGHHPLTGAGGACHQAVVAGWAVAAGAGCWAGGRRPGSGAARRWLPRRRGSPGTERASPARAPAARRAARRGLEHRGERRAGRAPGAGTPGRAAGQPYRAADCGRAANGAAAACGRATRAAAGAPSGGWGWSGCRDPATATGRRSGRRGRPSAGPPARAMATRAARRAGPAARWRGRGRVRRPGT